MSNLKELKEKERACYEGTYVYYNADYERAIDDVEEMIRNKIKILKEIQKDWDKQKRIAESVSIDDSINELECLLGVKNDIDISDTGVKNG